MRSSGELESEWNMMKIQLDQKDQEIQKLEDTLKIRDEFMANTLA